jgi:carboxy-cis,cis-muconate cyclase
MDPVQWQAPFTVPKLASPLYILSGSFRSLSLFLLAFSPINRTISHVQTIDAFGPHQYLATNSKKDKAYTTSWALPPTLSSWDIERSDDENPWRISYLNTVPISSFLPKFLFLI